MPNTMLFHIDLKSTDPGHATFVNDVVVAAGAEDRVKWGSFKYQEVKDALVAANPNVSVFYTYAEMWNVYYLFALGILWAFPLEGDVFFPTYMSADKQVVRKYRHETWGYSYWSYVIQIRITTFLSYWLLP